MMQSESAKEGARRLAAPALRDGFIPEALHLYADEKGDATYWRIRAKNPSTGAKWIRPMRRGESGTFELGEPQFTNGKPLYRLDELSRRLDETVLICEGEKAADALSRIGVVATTSGGADSADRTDWTALAKRRVLIWSDNDEPGARYGAAVAEKLTAIGCVASLINVVALALPEKGDAADWCQANPQATADDVLTLATVADVPWPSISAQAQCRPLPDPLPAVPPFNLELVPATIRPWVEDHANALQVPPEYIAVAAMVALGGIIGRQIGIAVKQQDRWIERPILWGAIVGRPSSGKSPALRPAYQMLSRIEAAGWDAYERESRDYEARKIVVAASRDIAKQSARKELKKGNQLAALEAVESSIVDESEPKQSRLVINDSTIEKAGEILNANPRGLVLFRDELAGWWASLDRHGREGDRAFWLECWSGVGPYICDRIGRGSVRIEAPAVSILGGVQPGKLAEYVRGAVRCGFADDGLIQRFGLAVYPDPPRDWQYTDRTPNAEAQQACWEIFKRLNAINANSVGCLHDEFVDIPFLRFDQDAQGLFIEWQTDLMTRLRAGKEPPFLESHFAKYPALVARLALVIHMTVDGGGLVSGSALADALNWTEYLLPHARRIYSPVTDGGLAAAHALHAKRRELCATFSVRELRRKCWAGLTDSHVLEGAIDWLIDYDYLRMIPVPTSTDGGRPTMCYEWCDP
jgi:5S rRNA maturation endonuclease (ribonuclease M5)